MRAGSRQVIDVVAIVIENAFRPANGPSVGIGAPARSYALPKKMYEQCETEEGNLLKLEELDGCRMARGRSKSTVPCN